MDDAQALELVQVKLQPRVVNEQYSLDTFGESYLGRYRRGLPTKAPSSAVDEADRFRCELAIAAPLALSIASHRGILL